MRSSWQCPKCQSLRVGFLAQVPDLREPTATGARSQSSPPRVLVAPQTEEGCLGSSTRDELLGEIEAFICADLHQAE